MKNRLWIRMLVLFGAWQAYGCPVEAQQVHRNGFESPQTFWMKGNATVPFEEKAHETTDQNAHAGQRSEHIVLDVKNGAVDGSILYLYPTGKALIGEELTAGVWVKANRPGIQLVARVVLPNERDPNQLDNQVTTVLRADSYSKTGQWQYLALSRPVQLRNQQQQLLQLQLKRPLNFQDAYVDHLMLNLYAGPGLTEAWLDDLVIGPLGTDFPIQPVNRPDKTPFPGQNAVMPRQRKAPLVEFSGNHIVVNDRRIMFLGVPYSDTEIKTLKKAGFNAVFFNAKAPETAIREAAQEGMWVVPKLTLFADDGKPYSPEEVARDLNRFAGNDSVLFYHLGMLNSNLAPQVAMLTQSIRNVDQNHPFGGEVLDGMGPYSRSLNLLGVHRWPLMTTLELPKYREWLDLRRRLANPGVFTWSWIQTHVPDSYTQMLYDRPGVASFDEPIGPQPEQVRLLTYTALAAGCRGLAFSSDRFLAHSHQGTDRLLCCALLNQEISMLEPLLVEADEAPEWIDTSDSNVKAAVMRCNKGVLVMPMWLGTFGQIVPGQAAAVKLSMVVPSVPQSMQAWEVSPGVVRGLKLDRVTGGTKVTLPEFGLTSAILFTSDTAIVGRFQDQSRAKRQLAAQWTYDMAEYELTKVTRIQKQLDEMGRAVPDAQNLLQDARKRLDKAKTEWENRDFSEAYLEAQRALRPVRILQRAQWEKGVRGLDSVTSSPYAVSYFTLPRHWQFMEEIKGNALAANVLPSGGFEDESNQGLVPWKLEETPTTDDIELIAQRVGSVQPPPELANDAKYRSSPYLFAVSPKEGKRQFLLQIRPKGGKAPPQALDRAMIAIHSPPVQIQPGTMVQISGWYTLPTDIKASPDGALFYDNAGGEPLALRFTKQTGWKKFTIFRRVPASGTIQVSIALTGLGSVMFDDIRIQPLIPANHPDAQAARNQVP